MVDLKMNFFGDLKWNDLLEQFIAFEFHQKCEHWEWCLLYFIF